MARVDTVAVLCRDLAEALIEVHPAFQQMEPQSIAEMETLTRRLAKALMQAADQEADDAAKQQKMLP